MAAVPRDWSPVTLNKEQIIVGPHRGLFGRRRGRGLAHLVLASLFLLVRHLLLEAMHLLLVASCYR